MPAVGVKPAPTPEIKFALEAFYIKWTEVRPIIDEAMANEKFGEAALTRFHDVSAELLEDLARIVVM